MGGIRNPTTLTPEGMETFRNSATPGIFELGMELATFGTRAHSHKPPMRFRHQPYPSVRDSPTVTLEHIWPDLLDGRLFVFSDKSEDYAETLMGSRLIRRTER